MPLASGKREVGDGFFYLCMKKMCFKVQIKQGKYNQ